MKKIRKILAILLAVILTVSVIPMQVFAAGEDVLEMSDEYLGITLSGKNGGFLISTVTGDKMNKADDNKNLLYSSENFDTSFTSFRVTRDDGDVEEYIFGGKYGFLGLSSSGVSVSREGDVLVAKWSVKDLTVEQRIALLDKTATQHGMAQITYSVTSSKDNVADVKVRILLDSSLGKQDYAYYQLADAYGEYRSVNSEVLLNNENNMAYDSTLFAVDDPLSPTVNAYTVNTTVGGEVMAPYQVAIGHWNNLASSVFDFAPDRTLDFTTPYNAQYRTADSAYALYFDMGALTEDTAATVSTYYGIFSNANVGGEEKVAINFPSVPVTMEMNEAEDAYVSQVDDGFPGDAAVKMLIENTSGEPIDNVTVVVKTKLGNTPYTDYTTKQKGEEADDIVETYTDFQAGEELAVNLFYNLQPRVGSEYRKFEVLCYAVGKNQPITAEKLIGSREFMVFCPGQLGETVVFNSMDPQIIYYEGSRSLFISGLNFALLEDTSAYSLLLKSVDGGATYAVPAKNITVNPGAETITVNVDEEMLTGTYQVVFDWYDSGREDITSTLLQFLVTDDYTYFSPAYGILTVERTERFGKEYKIGVYSDENDYATKMRDATNLVLLEFRGCFGVKRDADGNILEATGKAIEDVDGTIVSTITINNSVELEDGYVTVRAVNAGTDEQSIETDIEGRVFTSSTRSKIWDGVCAITAIENGKDCVLAQYHFDGKRATDVANTTSGKNVVTLLWPGAASVGQTIAGIIFEFRYCEFGQIAIENDSTITPDTPRERVIAFGAKLSPDFLIPSTFKYSEAQTSPLEAVQLKFAKSNYLPHQLRDVQERYKQDQKDWIAAQRGSLNLYVEDVLFGAGGFVGFNFSVDVGIPDYGNGFPELTGALSLSIMPRNDIWSVGVEGEANFVFLEMEASLELISYNGVPVPNQFFVAVEGGHPGINVDGVGILWVNGLGGGIDNLYNTMFSYSTLPPLALLLNGSFNLFLVFHAEANMSASLRGFDISLDEISLGTEKVSLIDHLGLSAYWYPKFKFAADMDVNILDIIVGGGYIAAQYDARNDSTFWEAFIKAVLMIPDYVPFVGSTTLAGVSMGANAEKIWGACTIIGLDMGVSYYWGGDVNFDVGKYDAPEPTIPVAFASIPVARSGGQTLYMSYGTNIVRAASNAPEAVQLSDELKIESTNDRMSHKLYLGEYKAYQDLALTLSFKADSLKEAELIAKGNKSGRDGIKLTGVTPDGETADYELNWLDNEVDATQQTDKNAILSYNSEAKEASVTISFTDEWVYDYVWTLKGAKDTYVSIYEVRDMASMDRIAYTYNETDGMTVEWFGEQLDMFEDLSIYAVAEDDEVTPLYETDFIANTLSSGSATFDLPATFKSGTYDIIVVASGETNSLHSTITAENKFTYVNPNQPDAPSVSNAKLGGDYTIDVFVSNPNDYDGFIATVYEKTADGLVKTDFAAMDASVENGIITMGGSYENIYYTDEDGNYVSRFDAQGRDDVTEHKEQVALEAGKKYCVGISGYTVDEDGVPYFSEEAISGDVTMVAPQKAKLVIKARDAVSLADSTGQTETIDVVGKNQVVIDITSDIAVSGEWILDSETDGTWSANKSGEITLEAVEEGEHTLKLRGENANGDGITEYYRFRVDATAPKLMISAPANGGFFGETTTVSGITDADATVVISVDDEIYDEVTADGNGKFSVDVAMNAAVLEHEISVYAKNGLGITSKTTEIRLNNGLVLGSSDTRLAIFVDGTDYTGKIIPAGKTGEIELRFVSGEYSVPVPANSTIGGQAEWNADTVSGTATISGQTLVTSADVNGILTVQLDKQQTAAVLGGNRNLTSEIIQIKLPEAGEGYEIKTENSTNVEYGSSFSFTIEVKEGYSDEDLVVTSNGEVIEAVDGVYTITDIHSGKTIEITGISDKTAPETSITIANKTWREFMNTITFGLLFDGTQAVTISASDAGSGVSGIYYYVSDTALTLDQIKEHEDWNKYSRVIYLEEGSQYVVYAKATDNAGNVMYISSDGITIRDVVEKPDLPEGVCEYCESAHTTFLHEILCLVVRILEIARVVFSFFQ